MTTSANISVAGRTDRARSSMNQAKQPEVRAHYFELGGRVASDAEYKRIVEAAPVIVDARTPKAPIYKPFSFLR